MTRRSEAGTRVLLRRLYAAYAQDKRLAHLRVGDNPVVPGDGPVRPRLLFVGEAPGANEARLVRPFVGASGALLNEMMDSVGLSRDDVFVTNVVKYHPPDNRDPTDEEVRVGIQYLRREHRLIGCPPIVMLGKHARRTVEAGYKLPLGLVIGQWFWMKADGGFPVLPLYHPAYGIYQRANRPLMFQQFKAVLEPPGSQEECRDYQR
jgi:uracil-DNA glycosylase